MPTRFCRLVHAPLTLLVGTMWHTRASGADQEVVARRRLVAEARLAAGQYLTVGQRLGLGRLAWQPLGVEPLAGECLALGRFAWWAVWGLPLAVGVLLAMRRLDGTLAVEPPLFGVLILVGLGLAATAAALLLCYAKRGPGSVGGIVGHASTWLLGLAPPAATLTTTWAVWVPSRAGAMPCLLLACALGQLVLFFGGTWGAYANRRVRAGRVGTAVRLGPPLQGGTGVLQRVVPLELDEVDQQLVRGRDAAGREIVAGTLRLILPRGSQHATAHVAFCPPLQGIPQVQCQQQSGPQARLKVTQAAPFGARLEANLPRPANSGTTVCVHFTAAVPTGAVAESGAQAAWQAGFEHAAEATGRSAYAAATQETSGGTQGG